MKYILILYHSDNTGIPELYGTFNKAYDKMCKYIAELHDCTVEKIKEEHEHERMDGKVFTKWDDEYELLWKIFEVTEEIA